MQDVHETPYVQCRKCNFYKVGFTLKKLNHCERCGATGNDFVERKVEGTGWHYVGDFGGFISTIGIILLILEFATPVSPFSFFGLNFADSPMPCLTIVISLFMIGIFVWAYGSYKDREGMKNRIEHEIEFLQKPTPAPSPSVAPTSQKGVEVKSAINYERAKIKYKVKIENAAQSAISEVRVQPFVPKGIFIADENEKTISLIKPNNSKTVTFTLRPTGECGNVDISSQVTFYDTKLSDYKTLKIAPKPTKIVCPMLRIAKIDEDTWKGTIAQLISVKETMEDIPLSCEELFVIVSDVLKDMNMFMLPPHKTSKRCVGRFYCEGLKGLKYAIQAEAIGGLQKSKLLLKAFAPNQESLIGFYHCVLDEIEERTEVKKYLSEPLIIHGDYIVGSKIDIKDSVVQRSKIG